MSDQETIVEIHSILVPCGFVDLLLTKADALFIYISFNILFSLQADTYILKQDDAHIPELVKGEDANDVLTIPAGAPDVAHNIFIS